EARGGGGGVEHEEDVAVADRAGRVVAGLVDAVDARREQADAAAEDLELADRAAGDHEIAGVRARDEPARTGARQDPALAVALRGYLEPALVHPGHRCPPTSSRRSCKDQIRGFLTRR